MGLLTFIGERYFSFYIFKLLGVKIGFIFKLKGVYLCVIFKTISYVVNTKNTD